jgi:hypothetical protein
VVRISHHELVALHRVDLDVHRVDLHACLLHCDYFQWLRHGYFHLLRCGCFHLLHFAYCYSLLRCEDPCLVVNRAASLRNSFNHAHCPTRNALLATECSETFCSTSFYRNRSADHTDEFTLHLLTMGRKLGFFTDHTAINIANFKTILFY